jgi:hypothetical protein
MKEEEERVQRSIREKRNNSTCTLFWRGQMHGG